MEKTSSSPTNAIKLLPDIQEHEERGYAEHRPRSECLSRSPRRTTTHYHRNSCHEPPANFLHQYLTNEREVVMSIRLHQVVPRYQGEILNNYTG